MYDATEHRFMAVDPIKGIIIRPVALSQYSFVVNNPLKYVDLTGLSPSIVAHFTNGGGVSSPPAAQEWWKTSAGPNPPGNPIKPAQTATNVTTSGVYASPSNTLNQVRNTPSAQTTTSTAQASPTSARHQTSTGWEVQITPLEYMIPFTCRATDYRTRMQYARTDAERLAISIEYQGWDWMREAYSMTDAEIYSYLRTPLLEASSMYPSLIPWWERDPIGFLLLYPTEQQREMFFQGVSAGNSFWPTLIVAHAFQHALNNAQNTSSPNRGTGDNANTPKTSGRSRAPTTSTPNSVYEQVGSDGKVMSRTFYDSNGKSYLRQDFTHPHFDKATQQYLQPHEHFTTFNNEGFPNGQIVRPIQP